MWSLMGPGEKCVSALLGEGKPWKVLDWLPLRPCPPSSQPRGSGGSVRCRDPADFQARGSPAPLSSASRDPPPSPPGTRKAGEDGGAWSQVPWNHALSLYPSAPPQLQSGVTVTSRVI